MKPRKFELSEKVKWIGDPDHIWRIAMRLNGAKF